MRDGVSDEQRERQDHYRVYRMVQPVRQVGAVGMVKPQAGRMGAVLCEWVDPSTRQTGLPTVFSATNWNDTTEQPMTSRFKPVKAWAVVIDGNLSSIYDNESIAERVASRVTPLGAAVVRPCRIVEIQSKPKPKPKRKAKR